MSLSRLVSLVMFPWSLHTCFLNPEDIFILHGKDKKNPLIYGLFTTSRYVWKQSSKLCHECINIHRAKHQTISTSSKETFLKRHEIRTALVSGDSYSMCLFVNASMSVLSLAFLRNVNFNNIFAFLIQAMLKVWLKHAREQRTMKANNHQRSLEEKAEKGYTNFIKKNRTNISQRWNWFDSSQRKRSCQTRDGEKAIFCSFWWNNTNTEAQSRQTEKTAIKRDSDSHINWHTIH